MPAPTTGAASMTWQDDHGLMQFQAMASPCEIHVEGVAPDLARRLATHGVEETRRIERKFSRYRDDNIITRINHAQGHAIEVDGETARLLDFAASLWELSAGRFDITSGILRRVWRFDGSDRIPSAAQVEALMPLVGWQQVDWDGRQIRLPAGMEIDLGGIGKEYAVDRVLERLAGEADAALLVNFGGDLRCNRPRADGQAWHVGVESTVNDQAEERIRLSSGALATSGDARRFLLRDGQRYSHILDPRTGWPVPDAPRSVTVAADTCTDAGALATLALLHGAKAEEFLRAEDVIYWVRRN